MDEVDDVNAVDVLDAAFSLAYVTEVSLMVGLTKLLEVFNAVSKGQRQHKNSF